MIRFLLPVLLCITSVNYAQCPFTVTLNSTGNCVGATLNITTANNLSQIVWHKDGVPVNTVMATNTIANGTTVAGGNGYGSAANQLYGSSGVCVDASGNVYIADYYNNRIQKWAPGATSGVTVAGGFGLGSGPGDFHGPWALALDLSGNLYVSDEENYRVQKFVPGSTIGTTVAGGNGSGPNANQLSYPNGVFVDAGGNVYVCDKNNTRIQKWAPGATSGVIVAGGNGYGPAPNQFAAPYAVCVDGAGNVYVADYLNDRVQKWPPGATSGITVAGGNGIGGAANQLAVPTGVFVDAGGNVYVADWGNSRVQKWPPGASAGITVAGGNGRGSASNQFHEPSNVFVDGSGNIYVADFANRRIQMWGQNLTINKSYVPVAPGNYTAMVTDAAGCTVTTNAIVINPAVTPAISIQTSAAAVCGGNSFTFTATAANGGNAPGYEWQVNGINTGATGPTYTSTTLTTGDVVRCLLTSSAACATPVTLPSNDITVTVNPPLLATLNSSGGNCLGTAALQVNTANSLSKIVWYNGSTAVNTVTAAPVTSGKTVAGNGVTFPNPFGGAFYGLYVDPGGNMYVTDPASSRILKFAAGSTTPVTVAGGNGRGSAANQFSEPWSVYVDVGGNIYVTDFNNSRVQKWAPGATTGVTVAGGNGPGSNANQLNLPGGVFVDAGGNVYVADRFNHRIQKWAPGATSGVTVAGGNGLGSSANQFNSPQGIFIDGTGNLYITDMGNNRVQKWAPGATSGVTVAGGNGLGDAANQLHNPWGVFVDAGGYIYITDGHRVQKWAPGATSGITVAGGNGYGSAANQLTSPTNVWVDVNGNIYIADGSNTRVQLWSKQPINTSYTPVTAGTYTATVTDKNGCTVTTNAVVLYPSVTPAINIRASATTVDACTPVTFNASVTNEGTAPFYQWQVNGVNAGANAPVYTASGLANGDIVTCTLTTNAPCATRSTITSNSITITVQQAVTPFVSITASATTSCTGSPVTFTARPVNGGPAPLFEWQVNGINTGVTGDAFSTNTLVDKDAVTCIMTSNANCVTTATANSNTIVITVNSGTPIPVSITSSAATICSGIPVSFTATVATNGPTPIYQWQVNGTNAGNNSPTYTSSTLANGDVVSCITTNTNGCEPVISNGISMVIYPTPHVEAQTIYISAGETVTLDPDVSGNIIGYLWSPGTGLSGTTIANPVASPLTTTVYTLQVSTANGCKASGDINIQVSTKMGIPNAFTPNGDGKNDIFYIRGGQAGSRIGDFAIFNRWGQKVFQQHNIAPGDPAFGWNGNYRGMPAAAGTYAYAATIRFEDGSQQIVRGTVILIR